MTSWEDERPAIYSVATGFFPEASPKETWATNPRPLLVCGTAWSERNKCYLCRIAYGTTKTDKARGDDLVIANLSIMDTIGLKKPTCFVIHSGAQMVIMPWTKGFFQPWTGYSNPVLSVLPSDIQRYVGHTLASLSDLPNF